MTARPKEPNPYLAAFGGSFIAALRWPQLDALWARLRERADAGWFLYAVGEPPPTAPADTDAVMAFIAEIDRLLRAEHRESFCGIVYADSLVTPTFVKIYNPGNLGVVCGFSEAPPLPGWVMSLIPPVDLPSARPPPKQQRRWWAGLFRRGA